MNPQNSPENTDGDASPVDPYEAIMIELGWQSDEEWDDTVPDYAAKQQERAKKGKPYAQPPPEPEISDELAAARKMTWAVFMATLAKYPAIKQQDQIRIDLANAAWALSDYVATLPAEEQQAFVEGQIQDHLGDIKIEELQAKQDEEDSKIDQRHARAQQQSQTGREASNQPGQMSFEELLAVAPVLPGGASRAAAPMSDMMEDILAEMGWQTDEDFIDTDPGCVAPELRPQTRPMNLCAKPATTDSDTVFCVLEPIEKAVVRSLRDGSSVLETSICTGLSRAEVEEIWARFLAAFRQCLFDSANSFIQSSLAS